MNIEEIWRNSGEHNVGREIAIRFTLKDKLKLLLGYTPRVISFLHTGPRLYKDSGQTRMIKPRWVDFVAKWALIILGRKVVRLLRPTWMLRYKSIGYVQCSSEDKPDANI